jgi:hypothetical protein
MVAASFIPSSIELLLLCSNHRERSWAPPLTEVAGFGAAFFVNVGWNETGSDGTNFT